MERRAVQSPFHRGVSGSRDISTWLLEVLFPALIDERDHFGAALLPVADTLHVVARGHFRETGGHQLAVAELHVGQQAGARPTGKAQQGIVADREGSKEKVVPLNAAKPGQQQQQDETAGVPGEQVSVCPTDLRSNERASHL
jgi:hypothetical protein